MTISRKTARTPISELALLQREIHLLFERLTAFDREDSARAGDWSPAVDVFECHENLVVVAEVPGMGPESLRVAFRDRCLVISGDRRERRPAGGVAAFLCMERPHGRFTRKIPLEMALDVRAAEARLGGGLLTVTIPRLKERRGREAVITVVREHEKNEKNGKIEKEE